MGFLRKVRNVAQGAVGAVIPRPGGDVGGVPARGRIVEILQGPFGENNTTALWNGVTVTARVGDGPVSEIHCYLKTHAWRDLSPGRDVPVRVDETTGALLGIDCEAYETEIDERPPMPSMKVDNEPAAGALAPIEGVSLELWVSVQAGIAKNAVPPGDYDAFAVARGVPPGRWIAISSEWQARANRDWKVGAKFGELYAAAMRA